MSRAKRSFGLTNVIDEEVLPHSALPSGLERLIVRQSIPTLSVKDKVQEVANPAFQELERLPLAPRTGLCSAPSVSINSQNDKADLGSFR